MVDIPTQKEAVITDPHITFCEDHYNEISQHINPIVAISLILEYALSEKLFYETAYRMRNGYGMPEDMETDSVPEDEQPDIIHINKAIREFAPLCCWLQDEIEGDQLEKIKQGINVEDE